MINFTEKKAIDKRQISGGWRTHLHEIIFEAETPAGKYFDIILLLFIIISVITVMLDSVQSIKSNHESLLKNLEWAITIIFTIEYAARFITVGRPLQYAFSFLGIIDLLAVIPTYLSLLIPGSHFLIVIRTIRLLRIFRIFKLSRYLGEAGVIISALKASRYKITVFLGTVGTIVIIMGTLMYVIEGAENGFTSIPRGIYWAIVTLTTVGYGDIAPKTITGQWIASMIMIMGYGILAVPTGILSAEFVTAGRRKEITTEACPVCSKEGHDKDADFCKYCGSRL